MLNLDLKMIVASMVTMTIISFVFIFTRSCLLFEIRYTNLSVMFADSFYFFNISHQIITQFTNFYDQLGGDSVIDYSKQNAFRLPQIAQTNKQRINFQ